jgi:hypothetical protein
MTPYEFRKEFINALRMEDKAILIINYPMEFCMCIERNLLIMEAGTDDKLVIRCQVAEDKMKFLMNNFILIFNCIYTGAVKITWDDSPEMNFYAQFTKMPGLVNRLELIKRNPELLQACLENDWLKPAIKAEPGCDVMLLLAMEDVGQTAKIIKDNPDEFDSLFLDKTIQYLPVRQADYD